MLPKINKLVTLFISTRIRKHKNLLPIDAVLTVAATLTSNTGISNLGDPHPYPELSTFKIKSEQSQ